MYNSTSLIRNLQQFRLNKHVPGSSKSKWQAILLSHPEADSLKKIGSGITKAVCISLGVGIDGIIFYSIGYILDGLILGIPDFFQGKF